jgi:nitrogen fixation protein NifQ
MIDGPGDPNDRYLAQMLSAMAAGLGALPYQLGLSDMAYAQLVCDYFDQPLRLFNHDLPRIDLERAPEIDDLRNLLLDSRAGRADSELWIADMVCAGCMASDHLWSDLGLFAREDLTAMMQLNFPTLAAKNDRNMKWKKFLYKQLCEMEGIYICRAPSCETCADYAKCFMDA